MPKEIYKDKHYNARYKVITDYFDDGTIRISDPIEEIIRLTIKGTYQSTLHDGYIEFTDYFKSLKQARAFISETIEEYAPEIT